MSFFSLILGDINEMRSCTVRTCNWCSDGVKVKGYFAWSVFDNYEWSSGYNIRFGINYVNYNDGLKRYPKLSAHWFKSFLEKS